MAIAAIFGALCGAIGCKDSSNDPDPFFNRDKKTFKRTVLLYAIASNNLYSSAEEDMEEMLSAAASCDLDNVSFLVYLVGYKDNAELMELCRGKDGIAEFRTVKEYDRSMFSTDPRRLYAVIDDMRKLRNAENYGLVLWSHGTGWSYSDTKHPTESNPAPPTVARSFGHDSYNKLTDYMNIDELAGAIPSGLFDFIWFDACYMSGIETIYQLRDKCDIFVGYPTEVWMYGMPYDETLPLILKPTPNLVGAADLFTDYYKNKNLAWTIAVLRMSGINDLAQAAREVYRGATGPDASELVKYSRRPCGPFYDFGQMTSLFSASGSGDKTDADQREKITVFWDVLKSMTLYSSSSEYNFSYPGYGIVRDEYLIDSQWYSGINCRHFSSASDFADTSDYYRNLDWFQDVIAPSLN